MAGAVCTIDESRALPSQSVKLIVFSWTSDDATGAVTSDFTSVRYTGQIVRVFTTPDGTAAPTALYDVTLLDEDSIDVSNSGILNRSATATEVVYAAANINHIAASRLKIAVTNAGNAKRGVVRVYIR